MSGTFQVDLNKRLEDSKFAEEYGDNIAKAEIAVTIAQARRAKGVTQKELAGRLGKTQSYVAKLESGDANPTVGKVGWILAKMGLKLTTGINELGSSIENKELSHLSIGSNQTFLSLNNRLVLAGEHEGAVVGASWVPTFDGGIIQCAAGVSVVVVGTNNIADDLSDVIWQSPGEDRKIKALK